MTAARVLTAAAGIIGALLVQTTVLARLPLPGAPPDLLLVVVVACGLLAGPQAAVLTGFGAGLLADLAADHEVGRLALAYVVAGYLAGRRQGDAAHGVLLPVLVTAAAAAAAVAVYAAEGVLLDDPRVTGGAVLAALAGTVAYSAALTPVVVPLVAALLRRADRRR